MSYELKFLPSAFKEWQKLDNSIRSQFKKKLAERLEVPKVESAQLHGHPNLYKIKLRTSGYRLAYEVIDDEIVIMVIAVGKRNKGDIYQKMKDRLK
jgi:mRNA interferase RelE/StbE